MRKNDWISVEDRLPGTRHDTVLVYRAGHETVVAWYSRKYGQWNNAHTGRELPHVTHWQTLPEPPESA